MRILSKFLGFVFVPGISLFFKFQYAFPSDVLGGALGCFFFAPASQPYKIAFNQSEVLGHWDVGAILFGGQNASNAQK